MYMGPQSQEYLVASYRNEIEKLSLFASIFNRCKTRMKLTTISCPIIETHGY
jgi:hypothetical protein